MNIQLPTGMTINVSCYEYFFVLKDEDIDEFYQACIAENMGSFIDDPFHGCAEKGKIEFEEIIKIDEIK